MLMLPLFAMLVPVIYKYPGVTITLSPAATVRFTMEIPFPEASVTGPPLMTAL
jgi:hypothetical protein